MLVVPPPPPSFLIRLTLPVLPSQVARRLPPACVTTESSLTPCGQKKPICWSEEAQVLFSEHYIQYKFDLRVQFWQIIRVQK